jgi:hypothetical protein
MGLKTLQDQRIRELRAEKPLQPLSGPVRRHPVQDLLSHGSRVATLDLQTLQGLTTERIRGIKEAPGYLIYGLHYPLRPKPRQLLLPILPQSIHEGYDVPGGQGEEGEGRAPPFIQGNTFF